MSAYNDWYKQVNDAGGKVVGWPPDVDSAYSLAPTMSDWDVAKLMLFGGLTSQTTDAVSDSFVRQSRHAARFTVGTYTDLLNANSSLVKNLQFLVSNSGNYVYVLAPSAAESDVTGQQTQATIDKANTTTPNPTWWDKILDFLKPYAIAILVIVIAILAFAAYGAARRIA